MNNLFEQLLENDDDIGLQTLNQIYGHADLNEISKYYDIESFNNLAKNHNNHLRILHINACCLTNKFENLKVLLHSMKVKPYIICFTETWFESNTSNAYQLKNYAAFHLTRTEREHGGVTVYVDSNINASKLPNWTMVNDDIEILTLELTFDKHIYKLCTIYRPNGKHDRIKEFTEVLNKILSNSHNSKDRIILIGDLNINLLEYSTHNPTNIFLTNMQTLKFNPLVSRPTRFPFHGQRGDSSLLDHIFTNFILN